MIPIPEDPPDTLAEARRRQSVVRIDGEDHVFCEEDGNPVTPGLLRVLFAQALKRADGIAAAKRRRATFHTLRHTAASLRVQAGASIFDVSKILGHSTVQVTMRYAHFAPDASRDAIARLGRVLDLRPEAASRGAAEGTG